MTIDDLLAVKGVSDPQLSPDGSLVVYVVSELDRATDKNNSSLWLVPAAGGQPKQLTTAPGTNNHPRWSPDGKTIAFVSHRGGSDQVWLLPIDGGEPHQLTKLPIDVSGPIWSPKGDKIAFTAEVYPGHDPRADRRQGQGKGSRPRTKVRIYDRLMIRHWNAWDEGKRSHLFVADAQTGEAKDLTPKLEVNTPPAPFGGSSDYAWSPDGKELAFTAEPARGRRLVDQHRHLDRSRRGRRAQEPDGGQPRRRRPAGLFARRRMARLRQPGPGGVRVRPVGAQGSVPVDKPDSYELTKSLDRPVLSFCLGRNSRQSRRSSTTWGPSRSSRSDSERSLTRKRSTTASAPAGFPGSSPAASRPA